MIPVNIGVLLCLPAACVMGALVGAFAACVFPNSEDAGQRLLGGLLHMVTLGLGLAPGITLVVVGSIAQIGGPLTAVLGNIGILGPIVVATIVTGQLFNRYEPGNE